MASISAGRARTAKVLGLIGATHAMSHIYSRGLQPLFPLLVLDLDTSYTAVGLVVTVFSLAAALMTTPVGFVVDRLGGRRVLIWGLALQAAATAAVGFTESYWALLALFAFAGGAFSVYHPSDYAILSASVDESYLGRAFSFHSFCGNLGSAAAPMVMVSIAAVADWRTAFLVTGIAGLLLAGLLATQNETLSDGVERARREAKNAPHAEAAASSGSLLDEFRILLTPAVLFCFLFYVISNIGAGGFTTYGVSALVELYKAPLTLASSALTGFLIGTSAGILVGGWIADRYGARMTTAAVGFFVSAVLLLLVGTVSMPMVLIIAVLSASGFMRGTVQSSRDLIVLSVTPKGSTGKVFGFVYNGNMIGAATVPLIFGWMLDQGQPSLVFWLSGLFLIASLATFFGVKRLGPKS